MADQNEMVDAVAMELPHELRAQTDTSGDQNGAPAVETLAPTEEYLGSDEQPTPDAATSIASGTDTETDTAPVGAGDDVPVATDDEHAVTAPVPNGTATANAGTLDAPEPAEADAAPDSGASAAAAEGATFTPDATEAEVTTTGAATTVADTGATPDAADETVAETAEAPAAPAEAEAPAAPAEAETVEATAAPAATGATFTPKEDDAPAAADGTGPRRMEDLNAGMQLDGTVTSIAIYGIFVDVGVKRDGLVHISEMSDRHIASPDELVSIGDKVEVWVKSVSPEKGRISLTMRQPGQAPVREQRERRRPQRQEVDRDKIASLAAGQDVEGTVTGLAKFGAFVDIGVGKDGLVHISELSEQRINEPGDAVKVGDTHTFRILEVDPEGTRISLSLNRAQRAAVEAKLNALEPDAEIEGTVNGLAPFGAFIDIGMGRDGLVHISQLADQRVEKVEDIVKVGDKVKVRVLEIDLANNRISLTMKTPSAERPADAPAGDAPRRGGGGGSSSDGDNAGGGNRGRIAEDRQAMFEAAARRSREEQGGGKKRDRRNNRPQRSQPETYSVGDEEQELTGDATLEDLLNKFGGGGRKNRRNRDDEDGDGGDDQSDVISRTLQGNDG